ncbi:MAG: hypothetical protein WBN71_07735, partial [Acidimicrobiia bacterium]
SVGPPPPNLARLRLHHAVGEARAPADRPERSGGGYREPAASLPVASTTQWGRREVLWLWS